jgi:hypothetical protein
MLLGLSSAVGDGVGAMVILCIAIVEGICRASEKMILSCLRFKGVQY